MAISMLAVVSPEDMAEGFDQEPAELVAMLVHLAAIHDPEERAYFLKHFCADVEEWIPETQTRVHTLLAEMAMAIERRF
jgi:hypothetical protein